MARRAFRLQPCEVIQPVIHPVERRNPRRPRRQHRRLHRMAQPFPPRARGYPQIPPQVVIPHEQPRATLRACNLHRRQHPARAFDHRDHRLLAYAIDIAHLPPALHLGQYDIVRRRRLHRHHLHPVPGRPRHIDPHRRDALAKPLGQRRHRRLARGLLGVVRHSILQVQYHHVARQRPRLGDGARIGRGQEQQRSGVTQQHGTLLGLPSPVNK